jgi:REP element-mobilizing transposase RayT
VLLVELPGGRFHVTARSNERQNIFGDDTDQFHFLGLLAEAPERFGARSHASVLMSNHYPLLVETPEVNLSPAMQWLNGSYCVWFNQRHRRAGHLLQGRFKILILEDDAGWREVARYVPLSPVRLKRLGLDKAGRAAVHAGGAAGPAPEPVGERVAALRQFRWSSQGG